MRADLSVLSRFTTSTMHFFSHFGSSFRLRTGFVVGRGPTCVEFELRIFALQTLVDQGEEEVHERWTAVRPTVEIRMDDHGEDHAGLPV